jgi:TRAP transporter TAXI family solute receptor
MLRGKLLATTFIVIAAIFSGGTPPDATAAEITIGTGSRAGVYYQVGRALCRILRASADAHGLSCQADPTAGSIFNLENIRAGALDLGVAQSDWQYHALSGSGRFAEAGPDDSLRALFSVHSEPFTVVARKDSGLESFEDLKGHRVNVGNPGSGQRGTMEVVMKAMGWTMDDFSLANDLPASQQSLALCHDRVQAMVYTVGHPNPSVGQATGLCDARILPVTGEAIDKLISANPYYARTEIPGGIYIGNDDPVTTFGVMATVVTSSATDQETVYKIVSEVFENLEAFKKMHPAFGTLEPERMIRDGLSAPLHEGAKRYYQEKGWL